MRSLLLLNSIYNHLNKIWFTDPTLKSFFVFFLFLKKLVSFWNFWFFFYNIPSNAYICDNVYLILILNNHKAEVNPCLDELRYILLRSWSVGFKQIKAIWSVRSGYAPFSIQTQICMFVWGFTSQSTAMVMTRQSVQLTTPFSSAVLLTSTSCKYFRFFTDNSLSSTSGRRRMTIEIISWSNSKKVW